MKIEGRQRSPAYVEQVTGSGAPRWTATSRHRSAMRSTTGGRYWTAFPEGSQTTLGAYHRAGNERGATHETLSAVLFYWDRQQTLDFYANMAEQPLDVIYLGERCAPSAAP